MKNPRTYAKRLLLAAGLALAVSAPAAFGATGTTAAAPPLTLHPLEISVRGHEATVKVRASDEVTFSHSLTRAGAAAPSGTPTLAGTAALVNPSRIPLDGVRAPLGPGGVADPVRAPVYSAASSFKLTGLTSNTTYTLHVRATNRAGEQVTARQDFTTLKQRVRITLEEIVVHDDGDFFTDGDPTWLWSVEGSGSGLLSDCFPKAAGRCKEGTFGEGSVRPACTRGDRDHRPCRYVYVLAEENFQPGFDPNQRPGDEDYTSMPAEFTIRATAKEDDNFLGPLDATLGVLFGEWGAFLNGSPLVTWRAPQGVETADQQLAVGAHDGGFRSTMVFRFELFHDNAGFPPNDGRVHSASK